jgi:hypothetical protein
MNVIRHQAVADQFHARSLSALLEQIKVNPAFRVSLKDEAPRAALRDVMGNSWRNHPTTLANRTIGSPGNYLFVSGQRRDSRRFSAFLRERQRP